MTGVRFPARRPAPAQPQRTMIGRGLVTRAARCRQLARAEYRQLSIAVTHSLRAGFATAAAAAGVEERDIARQTGHRSVTVLRGDIRAGQLFHRNAAAQVRL